jgi:signal transduction histidine kinase
LNRHNIHLERDHESVPPMAVDKHQVLQILLNLVRNAEDSVNEAAKPEKLIWVRIRRAGDDRVRIEVRDNGVGLAPESLTRIFAHGFTTKPQGHGFGLHSGALAAKQLGGRLWAESDGPGQGAIFTLEIPLAPPATVSGAPRVRSDRRVGDRPQTDDVGGEVTTNDRYEVPSRAQAVAISSAPAAGA